MERQQTPTAPDAPRPDVDRLPGSWRGRAALLVGLGLFLAIVLGISDALVGTPVLPGPLLFLGLCCAALWLLSAPFIWRLAGRFPPTASAPAGHIVLHLVTALVFSIALTAALAPPLMVVLEHWSGREATLGLAFRTAASYFLLAKVLFYGVVVCARLVFDAAQRLRAEEVRTAEVHGRLVRARLDVLRMQMRPHFLFNALNAVIALVRTDQRRRAVATLHRLADLLRSSLDAEETPFAPLEVELAELDSYLAVERCRFEDRLDVTIEVEPEELLAHPVPRWILQPLVENAIRHGVEASPDAGRIQVRVTRDRGVVRVEVTDDGPGPGGGGGPAARGHPGSTRDGVDDGDHGGVPVEGIGLGNTRERLAQLYSGRARLDVRAAPGSGTRVTLTFPEALPTNGVGASS